MCKIQQQETLMLQNTIGPQIIEKAIVSKDGLCNACWNSCQCYAWHSFGETFWCILLTKLLALPINFPGYLLLVCIVPFFQKHIREE